MFNLLRQLPLVPVTVVGQARPQDDSDNFLQRDITVVWACRVTQAQVHPHGIGPYIAH